MSAGAATVREIHFALYWIIDSDGAYVDHAHDRETAERIAAAYGAGR